jgi:hypothetical protein
VRAVERRRGQATAELAALLAAVAVLVGAGGAALLRTGTPAALAKALTAIVGGAPRRADDGLSREVATLLERAAHGGRGAPGVLAAQAAVAAERGPAAADRIVRTALLAAFRARYGDLGPRVVIRPYADVSSPDIPRGFRYELVPSGPLVVARVATGADEARAAATAPAGGWRAAGDSVLGNLATGPAGAIVGREGADAAFVESRLANAAISAGTGLAGADVRAPATLPPPGDRAGDVVLCRPLVLLQADDRIVRSRPADYMLRIVVLRDGRPFPPELVPDRMRCSDLGR